MSDSTHTPHHQRPHPTPMGGPFLEFDLAREGQQLREEDRWRSGRNSKTLVKYADLRVILMALKAGMRVEEHQAEGRISVQTITGHIRMRASGRTFDLPAGRLLALDRATVHDVEALKESTFLLTIARSRGLRR